MPFFNVHPMSVSFISIEGRQFQIKPCLFRLYPFAVFKSSTVLSSIGQFLLIIPGGSRCQTQVLDCIRLRSWIRNASYSLIGPDFHSPGAVLSSARWDNSRVRRIRCQTQSLWSTLRFGLDVNILSSTRGLFLILMHVISLTTFCTRSQDCPFVKPLVRPGLVEDAS